MTGRIPFGLLTLLTVLACSPIHAQDQSGPPQAYGAQPAGFPPYQESAGQYHGFPLSYSRNPGPQVPGPPPRMIYEELPDDLGFGDGDTPLGKMLTETFRHSWFRGEYLLWNINGPGNVLLGAQTSTGVPSNQGTNFTVGTGATATTINVILSNSTGAPANIGINQGVMFNRTVNSVSGNSQSPGLDDFAISNLNGFRGTYGVPLQVGEAEFSAFVLSPHTASYDASNQIQPAIAPVIGLVNQQNATFISQALLVDGIRQPYSASSSAFLDYDISYHAKLATSAWGSEGNFVVDSPDPNSPFQLRPMFGFRYFNFRDRLTQGGQYNQPNAANPNLPSTVVAREIDSSANNNVLGPQLGMRAEFTQAAFRIGFEPKLMLGLNTWQSNLDTANVLSSTDPVQSLLQRGTTFSPLVDLKLYSNVALSKYVSAFVSYNFLFVGNVNRSYNDIIYNKSSTTNQSNFMLDKTYSNATLQGLSVGFDIRF